MSQFSDTAAGWQSWATTLGIVLGGIWAYFKFIKGRIYRPRLEVDVVVRRLEWPRPCLACAVSVKNLGAGRIDLQRKGTGLRLYAGEPNRPSYKEPKWERCATVDVLELHEWLEPGEPVKDEVAITVPALDLMFRVEVRLVCKQRIRPNITVYARRVVEPDQEQMRARGGGDMHQGRDMHPGPIGQGREDRDESQEWEKEKKETKDAEPRIKTGDPEYKSAGENKLESTAWEAEKLEELAETPTPDPPADE